MADALKTRGICVQLHRQHFTHNAPDEKWITEVSQKQWVIFTKDTAATRRPNELRAVIASRAREFTLANASLRGDEMAAIFSQAMPAIYKFLLNHQGPFIVRIRRSGELVQVYPPPQPVTSRPP